MGAFGLWDSCDYGPTILVLHCSPSVLHSLYNEDTGTAAVLAFVLWGSLTQTWSKALVLKVFSALTRAGIDVATDDISPSNLPVLLRVVSNVQGEQTGSGDATPEGHNMDRDTLSSGSSSCSSSVDSPLFSAASSGRSNSC